MEYYTKRCIEFMWKNIGSVEYWIVENIFLWLFIEFIDFMEAQARQQIYLFYVKNLESIEFNSPFTMLSSPFSWWDLFGKSEKINTI